MACDLFRKQGNSLFGRNWALRNPFFLLVFIFVLLNVYFFNNTTIIAYAFIFVNSIY